MLVAVFDTDSDAAIKQLKTGREVWLQTMNVLVWVLIHKVVTGTIAPNQPDQCTLLAVGTNTLSNQGLHSPASIH